MSPDRLIRRLNGPRGSALLAVALIAAPFAVGYSPLTTPPPRLPAGLDILTSVVPIVVYGGVWTAVAVLCVFAAFTDKRGRQRTRLDRAAWSAFVGLLVIWALSYMLGWVLSLSNYPPAANGRQDYIAAGIYTGVALFTAIVARAIPSRQAEQEHRRQVRYRSSM